MIAILIFTVHSELTHEHKHKRQLTYKTEFIDFLDEQRLDMSSM